MPPEEYMPLDKYISINGDPDTNGKGNKVTTTPDNTKVVRVASTANWVKTTRIIQQAVRETVVDDGSDEIKACLSNTRFAQLQHALNRVPVQSTNAASSSGPSPEKPALPSPKGEEDGPASDAPQAQPAAPVANPKTKTTGPVANSKTKAMVHVSGKAKGKAAAKRKGRPARDASFLLRVSLKELGSAKAGSKFFTGAWKNARRNWEKYLKDVGSMVNGEDDELNEDGLEQSDAFMEEVKTNYAQGVAAKKILDKVLTNK